MECRLSENHKSSRLNYQVRIDFNVEKTSPMTVGVKTAITLLNNSFQRQLGGLTPLLDRYVEVSPDKIANHDKQKNYFINTIARQKTTFFRNVRSSLHLHLPSPLIPSKKQVHEFIEYCFSFLECVDAPIFSRVSAAWSTPDISFPTALLLEFRTCISHGTCNT